jgi:uncharacterized protein (DUF4415 family)
LTVRQRAELKAVAALPDNAIDTRDMPEIADWSRAVRGRFYRPVKQQLTLRLDADLVAWFKAKGSSGYQTRINRALREYVASHGKRAASSRRRKVRAAARS